MGFTNLNELVSHLRLSKDDDNRLFETQRVEIIEVTESDTKIRWKFILENGMDINFQESIRDITNSELLENIKNYIRKTLMEENRNHQNDDLKEQAGILFIGGSWDGEYYEALVDDDGYPICHVCMPPRMPMPPTVGTGYIEPERLTLETYKLKVIETQTKNTRYEYHYLYTN